MMADAAFLIVLHFVATGLTLFLIITIYITGTAAPWPLFFKVAVLGALVVAIPKS